MIPMVTYRFKLFTSLLPFTDGFKRFLMLSLILNILLMILGFINPLFYKLFIDDVILGRQFHKIVIVIVGYLSIFLIEILLGYLKNNAEYTLTNTTLLGVKSKIWNRFFQIPFQEYETTTIGNLKMSLEEDTLQLHSFFTTQFIEYFAAFGTLICSIFLLFTIEWRLALFSMVSIPFTFGMDYILSKYECELNETNRENSQKMSDWLFASVQGFREVKALNLYSSQKRKFLRFSHHFALYFGKWIHFWTARVLVIPKIKNEFLMQFSLYFLGGLLIIRGELKIGNLLLFAMYYNILEKALTAVSKADADMQANQPYTDRLILELEHCSTEDKKVSIKNGDKSIRFENVSFSYPNTNKEVVHCFNTTIHQGERVAITGKSGCGKTTLLKLMTGLIVPDSGEISYSGIDLNDINLSDFHKRVGFVMQEGILFHDTIQENLLYGNNNATEAEIIDACKKACIYDFIMSKPEGFQSLIGERGIKLSGGQRQRIILARLFLRDVDIYIFDEATSSLDQYNENLIQDAIRNIALDKTIIVVAHRESSISLCSRRIDLL